MKIQILTALIAMGVAGTALAQDVAPPPAGGEPRPQLSMRLPPLPPGCMGADRQAPPPRPAAIASNDESLTKTLGLSGAQATKVQQVFAQQATQAQQLDQQRRAMDTETCRRLNAIVGDHGMARWVAALPPPPPRGGPGHAHGREPEVGLDGAPPPPQGK